MITIQTVILAYGSQDRGFFVTEDACKEFVAKYSAETPIVVTLGNSKNPIGKCEKVWYDEEKKIVVGQITLNLVISSNVSILNALETPDEKRILSCRVTGMSLNLGGLNESK